MLLLLQHLRKTRTLASLRLRRGDFADSYQGPSHLSRVQRSSNFGHGLKQQEEIIQLCSCRRSSGGAEQQQRLILSLGQLEEAPALGGDSQTRPCHKPEGCSSTIVRFFFPQTKLYKQASIILKQTKPAFLVFVLGCFFLGRNYFSEGFLVLFLLLWSAEDVPVLWYEIENTEV